MTLTKLSPVTRRLLPLYIGFFLQSLPFWYAIEKLFMSSIGFDAGSIGLVLAIMSAGIIVFETPSGILADRWSRKKVLMLGSFFLMLSSLVGGFSYNQVVFLIAALCWGLYTALYSGTYDSIVYDTVLEEEGDSKKFEYYLGRFRVLEGIGFGLGALAGGVIASTLSMRAAFFFTVPFAAISLLFIMRFKEPLLHKAEVADPVFLHIRQTFAVILKNKILLPTVIATVGFAALLEILFELNQLWFIELNTPVVLYGIISAIIFTTWALGGLIARRFRTDSGLLVAGLVSTLMTLGLTYFKNYWAILVIQFVVCIFLVVIGVALTRRLHDELPSKLRAGSASVVSTLARALLIPGLIFVGGIANTSSIFSAAWILVFSCFVFFIALVISLRQNKTT